jgi:hypothetical protein
MTGIPILSGGPLLFRALNRKLSNAVATKMPLGSWIFWYGFALFMAALIPLFFWIIQPSLVGKNGLRIGADSAMYLWYAGLDSDPALLKSAYNIDSPSTVTDLTPLGMISLTGNYIGPVVIAETLRSNFLIMLFNYILFFIALHYLFKLRGIRPKLLLTLLVANPITVVSILTLNKEIIALLAVALFAYYMESDRSKVMLLVILAVSLFARWELDALFVIFLLLTSRLNPWRRRRLLSVGIVVGGISLIYPLIAPIINPVFLSTNEIGGTTVFLNRLQEHYLFALAVIPKMLMNFVGPPLYMLYNYKTWDWHDVQNAFINPASGALMITMITAIILTKRFRLRKDLIYYSVVFTLILCASPFLQVRYMYPMYICACVELSRRVF